MGQDPADKPADQPADKTDAGQPDEPKLAAEPYVYPTIGVDDVVEGANPDV